MAKRIAIALYALHYIFILTRLTAVI